LVLLGGVLLGLVGTGCAHRREAYYPNRQGVRVRAPFVDVNVPASPARVEIDARNVHRGEDLEHGFDD
jgi:hypothetical protein